MRITVLIATFLLCSVLSFGQKEAEHVHTVGYHNIFYGGFQINNHGWGLQLRRGYHKTVKIKRLLDLDLVTLNHPKEIRQTNSEAERGFVFGKLNEAYVLRLGYGRHKVHAYKPLGGGVEIKSIYSFGVSSAFLKPVYYLIKYPEQSQAVSERFDQNKHELHQIVGAGSYFKGFSEIGYLPGIYGKFALNFEYSGNPTGIRALETGVVVDAFPKNVEIMAYDKNYPIFFSFYLSLQYGKKWYR